MVRISSIDRESPDPGIIEDCVKALKEGKLVIYPTETVYGLAGDARSDSSVSKVFKVKSRSFDNPVSVAVDSLSMGRFVGDLSEREEKVIKELLPGPLTVVVGSRSTVSGLLSGGTGEVGVRIPDHPVVLELISRLGGPITSTSANISGEKAPLTVQEAVDQLGGRVDFAIDAGEVSGGEPSTVVKITESSVEIIREGPVSRSDVLSVLE